MDSFSTWKALARNHGRRLPHFLLGWALLLGMAACTGGNGGSSSLAPTMEQSDDEEDGAPSRPTPKPDKPDEPCHYNGHPLHIGKRGGCYYLYDGKKKEYVDRSYCESCKETTPKQSDPR